MMPQGRAIGICFFNILSSGFDSLTLTGSSLEMYLIHGI